MTERVELHPSATAVPKPERRRPSAHDLFLKGLRAQQAIVDEQAAAYEAWLAEHEQGRPRRDERSAA